MREHGCVPTVTCPNTDGNDDVDFGMSANGFITLTDATDGFNDPSFTYSVTADPQYGLLSAGASGSYNLSSSSTRMAGAFAFVQDDLTVTLPGLEGQAGTLDISVTLDGTFIRTGAGAAAWVAVDAGSDPNPFSGNNQSFSFDYVTVPISPTVVTVDFVWGQPFYLTMILGAAVGTPLTCLACRGGDSNVGPATGTGSATADFLNTLTLSGLLPRDANGNPVLNAQGPVRLGYPILRERCLYRSLLLCCCSEPVWHSRSGDFGGADRPRALPGSIRRVQGRRRPADPRRIRIATAPRRPGVRAVVTPQGTSRRRPVNWPCRSRPPRRNTFRPGAAGRRQQRTARVADPGHSAHLMRGFSQTPRTHSFPQAGAYPDLPVFRLSKRRG